MNSKWALWAGAAIGAGVLLPGAAHAQAPAGGPFADVPEKHWAYDAVQQLAQRGIFTGYPDGTFSGKRALTRYEFAVALQRMLQEVQRQVAAIKLMPGPQGNPGERGPAGAPGERGPVGPRGQQGPSGVSPAQLQELMRQQGLLRRDLDALQKLAQEFSSELAMLGADVEQQKRNLQALSDRLSRLEQRVAKIPQITGAVNIGFRADGATANAPGFNNAGSAPIPGVVDRDGRFLNASNSLLKRVNEFYDIDLGITAPISDVATARLLLNAGNYLRGYLGNRISQVNPFMSGATGAGGESATPTFNVEDVVPYYLYLETPLKIGGVGTQLTVGKFGQQFTPYTLKMVDVDSYFYNDKTDLGDYPVSGARVNFKALGLNFSAYGGVHDTEYAQLTSTAGFLQPGVYSPDLNRFQPQGSAGPLIGVGSTLLEQSAGVRATYVGKRFQIGGTYLTAGGNNSDVPGVREFFRQLSVYGVDWRLGLFRNIAFTGAVTQSKWNSVDSGDQQWKQFGIGENDRRAWDLRLEVPIKKIQLTGFYKRIGDGFDAPGSWGRMGNWINPRGIEGFGGTLNVPLGHRLALEFEGADYNYNAFRRFGAPGSDLIYLRGGLNYPLTSRNSVGVGYERVDYRANEPGGVKRLEQYYNIGLTHQFSPNLTFRLLYQFMDVHSGSALELPGFNYKANIIATQFQARF
jgi:hypothetical protein